MSSSSSILNNPSASTALLALNATAQSMNMFENQISTGLAIGGASDNASYWSIATNMTSETSDLTSVSGALSQSASMLSTTTNALQAAISVVDKISQDLTTASDTNAASSMAEIQSDITAQQQNLLSIGNSATFNGVNLLTNSTTTVAGVTSNLGTANFAASYNSTGGTSAVSFISVTSSFTSFTAPGTELFAHGATSPTSATGGILGTVGAQSGSSILGMNISALVAGSTQIGGMLADVQTVLNALTTAASTIGSTQTNVTDQQTFISNLTTSLTNGVGSLVDADMNLASTKIAALQVQQQLGVQALSIANSNTQLILKLFGQ
jgi:flagellin